MRRGLRTGASFVAVVAAAALAIPVAIGATTTPPADEPVAVPVDSSAARISRQLEGNFDSSTLTDLAPLPEVTAGGWIIYDALSNEAIAAKEPTTPRPIASLAKLMTALIAVERIEPDEIITVPAGVNDLPADASRMDLRAGEKWPASQLLRGMLVVSANDAALALAVHVAKTEPAFVELMNARADDLGLSDTTFASSTGLDLGGDLTRSTPVDLVALAETVLKDRDIAFAVAEPRLELDRPGAAAGEAPLELVNRNPLIGKYPGVDGVKTGFTDDAGYMLVTHHVDAATGGELIVVTAGSSTEATRASDTAKLLDWARPFRTDVTLAEGGEPIGSIPVLHSGRRVAVFVCDDLTVSARVGQRVATKVVLPRMVEAPISEGDEVGELRASIAGADGETVPLCSASTIKADGWRGRVRLAASEYDTAWNAGIDEVGQAWANLAG